MTYHIFREPAEGFVAHTPVSRALLESPLLLQWIGQSCEDMWPAATRTVDAMAKWPGSQEPNQTGFSIANGTTDSIFVEISKDPKRAQRLSDGMNFFQSLPGLSISHAVDGYEWGSLRRNDDGTSTIVDIGGSHGQISIGIAKKYSFIHCIVQDLPEVLEHSSIPAELQTRVKLMEHDFFQEQPVTGAAAYFLRWILHDWPDTFAVKILKALIPALRPGSKVILNELCMPAVGTISVCQERYLR